eukprot:2288438-Pleurochrysis_carterae.AAC.1
MLCRRRYCSHSGGTGLAPSGSARVRSCGTCATEKDEQGAALQILHETVRHAPTLPRTLPPGDGEVVVDPADRHIQCRHLRPAPSQLQRQCRLRSR